MHARLLLNYIPFLHACLGHDPLFPEIGQLVQGVKRKIPLSDPTSDTDISGCESAILSVTLAQTDPIVSKYGHRAYGGCAKACCRWGVKAHFCWLVLQCRWLDVLERAVTTQCRAEIQARTSQAPCKLATTELHSQPSYMLYLICLFPVLCCSRGGEMQNETESKHWRCERDTGGQH